MRNHAFTFAIQIIIMMANTDEIVLESTEIQAGVEVETQSTSKPRRRQVRVERWSPVKRQASRVATARKRPTRELHSVYQPLAKRHRTWLLRNEIEAICQHLLLIKPDELLPTVISTARRLRHYSLSHTRICTLLPT